MLHVQILFTISSLIIVTVGNNFGITINKNNNSSDFILHLTFAFSYSGNSSLDVCLLASWIITTLPNKSS